MHVDPRKAHCGIFGTQVHVHEHSGLIKSNLSNCPKEYMAMKKYQQFQLLQLLDQQYTYDAPCGTPAYQVLTNL